MTEFLFSLTFSVPLFCEKEAERQVINLHESERIGDQISVGFGKPGQLKIDFFTDGHSAEVIIRESIEEVERIVSDSYLCEVGPDLVNLSILADLYGCSRQNMRKYASGENGRSLSPFPAPSVSSDNNILWHLFYLIEWFEENTQLKTPVGLKEVARAAAKINSKITGELLARNGFRQETFSHVVRLRIPLSDYHWRGQNEEASYFDTIAGIAPVSEENDESITVIN